MRPARAVGADVQRAAVERERDGPAGLSRTRVRAAMHGGRMAGLAKDRRGESAGGLSGGAGVSPVPALDPGRASSATSAARSQADLLRTLGRMALRPGGLAHNM